MSSTLTYNGISLPFVKTEKFDQEVVYSTDGVDNLYTKVTIGVGCVLSPCLFNGMSVSSWVNAVKPNLMVRGGQLYYMVDGCYVMQPNVTAVGSTTYNATIDYSYTPDGHAATTSPNTSTLGVAFAAPADAKLGPFPQRFDVRRIEGNTWLAYYEIVTYLPYCRTSAAPPYVLSNRWGTTVNIDEDYYLTRIIDGTLVINGQYANQTKQWGGTEDFPIDVTMERIVGQNIILPPCPHRWKRESIDIIRSSDGLTLTYKITDKQLYTAIPRPATRIDAQYTETSGTKDFALMNMMVCEIQVTVYGEPNANWNPKGTIDNSGNVTWDANGGLDYNKYNLMTLMFQVVLSRIPFPFLLSDAKQGFDDGNFNKYIIQYFQMKEDVFKPIVGCTVRALRPRLYNAQTIANITKVGNPQGIYGLTTIGSTILLADCINDIARQPENMLNYGQFLLAAQSLNTVGGSGVGTDNPFSTLTPSQLASAIMYPCDETGRNINVSLASSNTALGSTAISVQQVTYAAPGKQDANAAAMKDITNEGRYYSKEQYKNPFTEYTIDVQYLTNNGYIQLPIMYDAYPIGSTPATGCVIAQTSAGYTKKVCHWKASRLNQWPMIPRPDDIEHGYGKLAGDTVASAVTDKLLDYHITFADSFLMQDGISRKYEVAGVYECAMKKRLQWDQSQFHLPTCVNPITSDVWETTTASVSIGSASAFPNTLFVSGVVGYSASGPGGGNPNTP